LTVSWCVFRRFGSSFEDLPVVHCDAFLVLFGRSKKIYLVSSSQICRTNQLSIDTSLGNFPEIKHIFLKMANYATYTCFFAVSFLLVGFCEFLIFIINVQKFVWVMVLFSNHVSFFYPTGLLTVSWCVFERLVLHLKIYLLCTAPFWFFLAQQKDLSLPETKRIFLEMANIVTFMLTCFFAVGCCFSDFVNFYPWARRCTHLYTHWRFPGSCGFGRFFKRNLTIICNQYYVDNWTLSAIFLREIFSYGVPPGPRLY